MITIDFNRQGVANKLYIVKVAYPITENISKVGINVLLETKLSLEQVASVLAMYKKDSYKLTIAPVEKGKKFPAGYYESFTIDNLISQVSRLRFIETSVVEEPKVVYIQRTVTKEL
jgi:hypothetical protein